jgi:hypothetical protein
VAVGDVNGDGVDEIITGAGAGGGPHVKVFDAAGNTLSSFFAFNGGFFGGLSVAAGDVNGDGKADIIVGAGKGARPQVKVFSGADQSLLESFMAYSPSFKGGLTVAAGDFNGDGRADIVTGTLSGGPEVKVFDGASQAVLQDFNAFPTSVATSSATTHSRAASSTAWTSGAHVAVTDFNGDGSPDLVAAPGAGQPPSVRIFVGDSTTVQSEFDAFDPGFLGGVYVGGN